LSTYTGLLGTADFMCGASGSLTLIHGESETSLADEYSQPHHEFGSETLTINCLAATATSPPTPTSTPHPPPLGGVADYPNVSGGSSVWRYALIAIAIGVLVSAGVAFHARRRRRSSVAES
jgi:hypothetical protein